MPVDAAPAGLTESCSDISLSLAAAVEPCENLSPAVARHVDRCLRCQADVVRYRRIRRTMLSMADDVVVAHDAEIDALLERLRPEATVHRIHGSNRRKVYISGIAAAATAGAAGAIVIASRLSRTRLAS